MENVDWIQLRKTITLTTGLHLHLDGFQHVLILQTLPVLQRCPICLRAQSYELIATARAEVQSRKGASLELLIGYRSMCS